MTSTRSTRGTREARAGEPGPFEEAVLDLVARVPPGRVMAYGDVAEAVTAAGDPAAAGGPRQVGRAMARFGGGVPWWRVVRADGGVAPALAARARAAHLAEGTPLRADGARVDMARARWSPAPGRARDRGPAGPAGPAGTARAAGPGCGDAPPAGPAGEEGAV